MVLVLVHALLDITNSLTQTRTLLTGRHFGTDNITFEIGSDYPKEVLKPRKFTTFSSAAIEGSSSRVYGGVHFPTSGPHGLTVGIAVGTTLPA